MTVPSSRRCARNAIVFKTSSRNDKAFRISWREYASARRSTWTRRSFASSSSKHVGRHRKLLTLTPAAHRTLVINAALAGFCASGRGFNGEILDREKHPSLESLLRTHFESLYDKGEI